VKNLTLVKWQK